MIVIFQEIQIPEMVIWKWWEESQDMFMEKRQTNLSISFDKIKYKFFDISTTIISSNIFKFFHQEIIHDYHIHLIESLLPG